MGTPWNRDFFQLMTHVAAAYAKQEPDRKRKNTMTGKQERKGEGEEERVRGQSLEVMGIGRNSVGNPCRQTH